MTQRPPTKNDADGLSGDPHDRLKQLVKLFEAGQMTDALHLAGIMADAGQVHPLQTMILATTAEMLGANARFSQAIACVDRLISNDPSTSITMHEFEVLLMGGELRRWFHDHDYDHVLNHLRLARRLDANLGSIFPADPAHLLEQTVRPEPPDQTPRHAIIGIDANSDHLQQTIRPRRVTVFMRKYFFGPASREHDMGPRIAQAFEQASWACRLVDPCYHGIQKRDPTPEQMIAFIRESLSELVVIDHFGIPMTIGAWGEFTRRVRLELPNVKLVHAGFDPWIPSQWPALKIIGNQSDLIWSATPAGRYWDELGLRDKLALAPFPIGVPYEALETQRRDHFAAFFGTVESYNLSRAYWLAMLERAGLKISGRITNHDNDGLDAIGSYTHYLSSFRSSDCLLSFSMRRDGSRMLTGRSFESIFAGGCLIQERVDDLDYYFEPGQHYFRFESFADLRNLLTWLSHHPEEAKATAARGQAYYHTHYSDQAIVESLGRRLFPEV